MKMFRAPAITIDRPGPPVIVRLPAKCRIVFLERDYPPNVAPITEPGTYSIDIEAIRPSDHPWPFIIVIIRDKHVRTLQKLPQSEIDRIVRDAPRRPSIH